MESGDNDPPSSLTPTRSSWLNVQVVVVVLALLIFAITVFRLFRWRAPRAVALVRVRSDEGVPRKLDRQGFQPETYDYHRRRYVDRQITAYPGSGPPTRVESDTGMDIFRNEVLVDRHEFHLRHVTPDSLLRRVVSGVIRAPTPVGIQMVRGLFQILGADALLRVWDAASRELLNNAEHGDVRQWFNAIGRDRVRELRQLITDDLQHNLFISESQGNLHAGTNVDITEEGMVLIGRRRMEMIADYVVRLLDEIGWHPRLELVNQEFMLAYDGAAGEFWRYGYRRSRTHDPHTGPLELVGSEQRAIVLGNTTMTNQFWYGLRHERFPMLVCGACLVLVLYFLRSWPARL